MLVDDKWVYAGSTDGESSDPDTGFYADIPDPDNNFDDHEWPIVAPRVNRRKRRTRRHRQKHRAPGEEGKKDCEGGAGGKNDHPTPRRGASTRWNQYFTFLSNL